MLFRAICSLRTPADILDVCTKPNLLYRVVDPCMLSLYSTWQGRSLRMRLYKLMDCRLRYTSITMVSECLGLDVYGKIK